MRKVEAKDLPSRRSGFAGNGIREKTRLLLKDCDLEQWYELKQGEDFDCDVKRQLARVRDFCRTLGLRCSLKNADPLVYVFLYQPKVAPEKKKRGRPRKDRGGPKSVGHVPPQTSIPDLPGPMDAPESGIPQQEVI